MENSEAFDSISLNLRQRKRSTVNVDGNEWKTRKHLYLTRAFELKVRKTASATSLFINLVVHRNITMVSQIEMYGKQQEAIGILNKL